MGVVRGVRIFGDQFAAPLEIGSGAGVGERVPARLTGVVVVKPARRAKGGSGHVGERVGLGDSLIHRGRTEGDTNVQDLLEARAGSDLERPSDQNDAAPPSDDSSHTHLRKTAKANRHNRFEPSNHKNTPTQENQLDFPRKDS